MLKNVKDNGIYGFSAVYVGKSGEEIPVVGTFALGPMLSWHDKAGNWCVIDGIDQRR